MKPQALANVKFVASKLKIIAIVEKCTTVAAAPTMALLKRVEKFFVTK